MATTQRRAGTKRALSIRILEAEGPADVQSLLERPRQQDAVFERRVAAIVDSVRTRGDTALLEYARRFDQLSGAMEVSRTEIETGAALTPIGVRKALRAAARQVRRVAERQVPRGWRFDTRPGVSVEQRVLPLDRVGCYVPAGRYPLPSSLLMTAIPARAAGVGEVIVVCPRPAPVILAAALEAGVDRLFRIGGAHAVAALAYGTETIPRVDKIVGPGNVYVAAAKARVAVDCAIDFYAGPSEILIVTSDGRAAWVAADLIAQAEHDPDARAMLVTWNRRFAEHVATELARQAPATGSGRVALQHQATIVIVPDRTAAIAIANGIAAEHVVCGDERLAKAITRAGAIFVGPYTAQAAGDYATGSNHVLPTGGAARSRGGLSAADFVRISSIQRLTESGLRALAPTIVTLAEAEGLHAHAASIRVRMK